MSDDPYDNMPSLEDLKEAGATEWFSESLAQQKKRNEALKASLGGETASLKAERENLKNLLKKPPKEEDKDRPPDLFAAERAKGAKEKDALSGLLGDLDKSKAAEKEMLKNLFGDPNG